MESAHHDTLVYRLAQMLVKLNQGEKLDPPALGPIELSRCLARTVAGRDRDMRGAVRFVCA